MHIAADGDAFSNRHAAVDHIPFRLSCLAPRGLIADNGIILAGTSGRRPGNRRSLIRKIKIADGSIIGHGNLIHYAIDGDLHPFGGGERLMCGHNPLPAVIFCSRKQGTVADRHCRCLTGQAHRCQNIAQGSGRITLNHILQVVVGKLHRIERKTIRFHRGGILFLPGDLQLFCGTFVEVVDLSLKILVGYLCRREGHADRLTLARLVFLARNWVHDLDVEGVARHNVFVLAAHFVYSLFYGFLVLLGRFFHLQRSLGWEHALRRTHRHFHAVHGAGLLKGGSSFFLGLNLQRRSSRRFRFCLGFIFRRLVGLFFRLLLRWLRFVLSRTVGLYFRLLLRRFISFFLRFLCRGRRLLIRSIVGHLLRLNRKTGVRCLFGQVCGPNVGTEQAHGHAQCQNQSQQTPKAITVDFHGVIPPFFFFFVSVFSSKCVRSFLS